MPEMLVVLVAYCSMGAGICDLITQRPQQPFASVEQCRRMARVISANQSVQEQYFNNRAIPGPWRSKVVCGTVGQADEINAWLTATEAGPSKEEQEVPNGG